MISTTLASHSTVGASATRKHVEASDQAKQPETGVSKQEAQQPPADAYGNAVVVSVSGDRSTQTGSDAERYDPIELVSTEEVLMSTGKIRSVEFSQSALDSQKWMMEFHREKIEFLELTEPVPARVLEGDEAKETLRMLNAFKPGDVVMGVSESGRRAWRVDDLVYAQYPNGTLTVGEASVPETQEEHDYLLSTYKKRYEDYKDNVMKLEASLATLERDGYEVVA